MNVVTIGRKLLGGEWHYALGRFHWVRQMYTGVNRFRYGLETIPSSATTIFPRLVADQAVADLTNDAVALGFDLPLDVVQELRTYASTQPLERSGDQRQFYKSDVVDGRLADGSPVVLGHVRGADKASAVQRICTDPTLRQTVMTYLGYRPRHARVRLFWSFVLRASESERMNLWQTVKYHYDVGGFNFVYANFYLTDVDSTSGAHVLIKGSHTNKPIRMLLSSANQPDQAVLSHFGANRELMVCGKAGTGFLEDSSCYHKAVAPSERERLLLQIRFS
jgi:hypothetical protein